MEVSVERNVGSIQILASGADKPWQMILRGIAELESVDGARWEAEQAGVRLILDAGA